MQESVWQEYALNEGYGFMIGNFSSKIMYLFYGMFIIICNLRDDNTIVF